MSATSPSQRLPMKGQRSGALDINNCSAWSRRMEPSAQRWILTCY